LSADGQQLLVSDRSNHSLHLLDWQTGRCIRSIKHPADLQMVTMTPDGRLGLSLGGREVTKSGQTSYEDCAVRVWDLQNGQEIARLDSPNQAIRCGALSADGRRAVTCSTSGHVAVWELPMGRRLAEQKLNQVAIVHVRFSPDGQRIVGSGYDKRVRIWATDKLLLRHDFVAHDGQARGLAISPDSKYLLTGCGTINGTDRTVRLWDVESGRELKRFVGHTNYIYSVAFSPDGTRALSTGADRTICIWDLAMVQAAADVPMNAPLTGPPGTDTNGNGKLVPD
jgi:WD40 repeat protein